MKHTFKIIGITETTIINEHGKVIFDATEEAHTGLTDHKYAKEVTILFARAPELLEALQNLVEDILSYSGGSDPFTREDAEDLVKEAQQAINKATEGR